MSTEPIYVVMGTQGDYSSREVWVERAFLVEREAQLFAEAATRKAAAEYLRDTGEEPRNRTMEGSGPWTDASEFYLAETILAR